MAGYSVAKELAAAYGLLFVGRRDSFAVQQRDGSYRPVRTTLTVEYLREHLAGRCTLGTYVLDEQERCQFAVFDADQPDGLVRLVSIAEQMASHTGDTTLPLLEMSRRGGHLWIHFDQLVPAAQVRAWLLPYAQAYGVELYPKQESLRDGGLGSLIRLPLGVHRVSGQRYPFVVMGTDGQWVLPCQKEAWCAWAVQTVQRVTVPMMAFPDDHAEPMHEQHEARPAMPLPKSKGAIRAWCAQQDIVALIGQYTRLDRMGVGRCPLPGHHARGDERPSLQVFGGSDPHWYCYTWGRAGNVFDFLQLYHGLTVQEAWERVQQGVLW